MEQILAHPFLAISGDGDDAVDTDGASASHVYPRIDLPSPVPLTSNATSNQTTSCIATCDVAVDGNGSSVRFMS